MVILFVDVIIIRSKYRETFSRIQLAPDWVFYLCAVIGAVATAYGVFVTFTNPWTVSITTITLSTLSWDLWIGGIGVISLIVGALLYFIGQATIRHNVSDEEIIAEVTGGAAGGE